MTRARGAIVGGVVGLLVLVALGSYASLRVWNYTQHDPAFCRSCHVMESAFEKWQSSVHAQVECHACHEQSMRDNLEQLVKFIALRPDTIGKHAEVDFQRCGSCHLSNDARWKQVAETPGHKVHFERLGLECVACHSRGVHRFVRPTESCQECHPEQTMQATRMEELHCTACHNFLVGDGGLVPTRQRCLDCHTVLPTAASFPRDAPMRFACNQCHKPHHEERPTSDDCRTCHHMAEYGLHAGAGHQDCVSCHPPHSWTPSERESCEACHSDRRDHYPEAPCSSCHDFGPGTPALPAG